jgi:cysteine desulfurase
MTPTYLDHAASAPLRPEALEAMLPHLQGPGANPSSVHPLGLAAREAIEKARNQVAALINADPAEVIFTSGATEANNLALRGVISANNIKRAVVSNIEHPSVSETFAASAHQGLEVVLSAPEAIASHASGAGLVSCMWVNNEVGTIQPILEIAAALGTLKSRPLFHVDAVQAAVAMPIDFRKSGIDLLTLSAHKIGGPQGVGALVVRKGVKIEPLVYGGGQESGRRSGTENVAGIVGFGAAAESLRVRLTADRELYASLGAALDRGLTESGLGLHRLPLGETSPHVVALEWPGAEADFVVLLLGREGVMISAGSACHAGSRETSKVLRALGLSDVRARSVFRVSFGPENTAADVERLITALNKISHQAKLRK